MPNENGKRSRAAALSGLNLADRKDQTQEKAVKETGKI